MANPSNLQVTPCVAPAECHELNFHGLYLFHTPLGPKANQASIIEGKGPMGATVVNNWPVCEGPEPDARVVARAQGFHMAAGSWFNCFSLVFENESSPSWVWRHMYRSPLLGDLGPSFLQVMGITVESGEWAIVGGTGQFAMASGVITKMFHEQRTDGNIIQLTIRAFCPLLKGTRYPVTKLGTWGGNGGNPMDIKEASKRLESITVHTGVIVDSIQFSYVDYAGQKHTAGPWGGSGGHPHTIQLAESEFITEVSGTVGSFNDSASVISSIKFVTNLGTYGPWGEGEGTPFTVPVQDGSVVGFFARSEIYLDAIGVYVRPL